MDQDGLSGVADESDTGWRRDGSITVPVQLAELPDGGSSLMIGDVSGYAAFNHLQGDNPEHDYGDCGVMCCAEVLNQFGVRLTEADAVRHATLFRELHVVDGRPDLSGWTLPHEEAAILCDYGVPAHAEEAQTIERLAFAVQHGHAVIALVNAGVLWCDPRGLGNGHANHAVTVTGIARHPYDGALQGFYINDSGNGQSGRFVSAHLMTTAFERTGGFCVVTDGAAALNLGRPRPQGPTRRRRRPGILPSPGRRIYRGLPSQRPSGPARCVGSGGWPAHDRNACHQMRPRAMAERHVVRRGPLIRRFRARSPGPPPHGPPAPPV